MVAAIDPEPVQARVLDADLRAGEEIRLSVTVRVEHDRNSAACPRIRNAPTRGLILERVIRLLDPQLLGVRARAFVGTDRHVHVEQAVTVEVGHCARMTVARREVGLLVERERAVAPAEQEQPWVLLVLRLDEIRDAVVVEIGNAILPVRPCRRRDARALGNVDGAKTRALRRVRTLRSTQRERQRGHGRECSDTPCERERAAEFHRGGLASDCGGRLAKERPYPALLTA
jgi:hypothetical protein